MIIIGKVLEDMGVPIHEAAILGTYIIEKPVTLSGSLPGKDSALAMSLPN
jgi:hypothetical protein